MNKPDYAGLFFRLIDSTGADVNVGDTVVDFRGGSATIVDASPPHKPTSTGQVQVARSDEDGIQVYYPGVFNLKWVPA